MECFYKEIIIYTDAVSYTHLDAINEIPNEYVEDGITIDKIMILYGREK